MHLIMQIVVHKNWENLNSKLPEAKKNENKSWLVQDLYQIGLEGARSFFTNHRAK